MVTKRKFLAIIKKASQPLIISGKSRSLKRSGDYSGKQTRQRNAGDTSGKRSGKSH